MCVFISGASSTRRRGLPKDLWNQNLRAKCSGGLTCSSCPFTGEAAMGLVPAGKASDSMAEMRPSRGIKAKKDVISR